MTERDFSKSLQPLLNKFKNHIRMTSSEMDEDLKLKLMAAVRSAEHYIGKVIARSTFTLVDTFAETFALEPDVASVSSVKVDGRVLSGDEWKLSGNVIHISGSGDTVEVEYISGPKTIEYDVQAAILLHAAALFNNPVDSVETLPKASTRLLDPYRTWGVR